MQGHNLERPEVSGQEDHPREIHKDGHGLPFGIRLSWRQGLNLGNLGREVQEETMLWWMTQAEDVREEALGEGNRVSLTDMYKQLNRFCVGVGNIWCQGPAFDIVILENIYRQKGWPTPWQFWQIRDSRTLFGVHGDPREKGKAGLHNALEDCISQAQGVQQIYHALKLEKRTYANR